MTLTIEMGRVNIQDALYLFSAGAECLDADEEGIEFMIGDMVEHDVIGAFTAGALKEYVRTVKKEKAEWRER